MRTGTKDGVCVVKRRALTKKQVLAVSPLRAVFDPVLESDVVGYFIHSFRAPNPSLNAVHGRATDARGNIYVTCMRDGATHKYSPEARILDSVANQILAVFERVGHPIGELTHCYALAAEVQAKDPCYRDRRWRKGPYVDFRGLSHGRNSDERIDQFIC